MILSDGDILKEIKEGNIIIDPFKEKYLQPASVDLHLGDTFLVYDTHTGHVIDPKKSVDGLMRRITISGDQPFVLHPGDFALGAIYETTGVSSRYVGRLEGKSSVGRLGILVHVTAGFLDPGNKVNMTLELHNTATLPVLLYYKMPIAQMAFQQLSSPSLHPYSKEIGSKYIGDKKPKPSQMWKNFQQDETTSFRDNE